MRLNLWIGGILTPKNRERIIRHVRVAGLVVPSDIAEDQFITQTLKTASEQAEAAAFSIVFGSFHPKDLVQELADAHAGIVVRYEASELGIFFDGREQLGLDICNGELFLWGPPANKLDPLIEVRYQTHARSTQ